MNGRILSHFRVLEEIGRGGMGIVYVYCALDLKLDRKVDHRSDIFSFGIFLHEKLTGEQPFRSPSDIETLNVV